MKKFTTRPRAFATTPAYCGSSGRPSRSWVWLGRLAEAGPLVDVRLDTDYAHVVGLFGKRGSGKSYTLGSILEGLCTTDKSSAVAEHQAGSASLLFDTLGIFQWMNVPLPEESGEKVLIEQLALRKGWNLKSVPLGVDVWIPRGSRDAHTPATHKEFAVNCSNFAPEDWGYLLGLDIYQDRMGQLLNDAYIKLTSEGWQYEGRRQSPSSSYTLGSLLRCLEKDDELQKTYAAETRRALGQQLATFQRNPLFADDGTPLTELLKPGRMSVVVMNKMPDELRLIVVAAFLRQLIAGRISVSEAEKHLSIGVGSADALRATLAGSIPRTWVAIDEAQNILPAERTTAATEVIVKYVREGRNYGLSFIIATQQPTSVDARILAQVDTLIAHKLTVQGDIEYIRRNLKSNLPDETKFANAVLGFDDLMRMLDTGQALVSNTETDRAFIADIRPRVSVHGGF